MEVVAIDTLVVILNFMNESDQEFVHFKVEQCYVSTLDQTGLEGKE